MPAYISAHDAQHLLGVKRNNFYHYVHTGQIRKQPGTVKPHVKYSTADIIRIKERRERRKGLAPIILDWLSPKDIPAILRLDQIVYDEIYLAEMETYRQWSEKNPQLAMAAFDARSNRQEMLAYIAALPLDESVILSILRGDREETSITKDEIQDYCRPGSYILLANSAVTHPDRPDLLFRVLYRMAAEWVERYPERYVTRIYSQSISERGDMLVQHFFMAPRYDLAPNAYMLDLSRPGASKLVQRFQAQLKAKAPLPKELQYLYSSGR